MNVIDILKDRQIKYKESAKDYLVLCFNPEHDDSNPSMHIDKITGVYHCFSCGYKGNIFRKFGAEPNFIELGIARLQQRIRKLSNYKSLVIPADAVPFNRDYRGLSSYIYSEAEAFTSNQEDEFKDRILFPIRDIRGNIKVFIGRSLHSDVEDKYLFYPEKIQPPLFPAHPEIYKNSLIIVEGIFDVLNMMDKGCYNVICAFGTHTLLKTFREKLSHYKILGVNKFYIMFDGDRAGRNAGQKLEEVLNLNGFNAETIELPDDMDPGDLTEEHISILMRGLYGEIKNN